MKNVQFCDKVWFLREEIKTGCRVYYIALLWPCNICDLYIISSFARSFSMYTVFAEIEPRYSCLFIANIHILLYTCKYVQKYKTGYWHTRNTDHVANEAYHIIWKCPTPFFARLRAASWVWNWQFIVFTASITAFGSSLNRWTIYVVVFRMNDIQVDSHNCNKPHLFFLLQVRN